MASEVLMPALSPTMTEGKIARWIKSEGEAVKAGDIIAEIETDKATMEVEAIDEGVLAKIVVPEGTTDVPVNELIAVLAGEGEDVKGAAAARAPGAPTPPAAPIPAPSDEKIRALFAPDSYEVVPHDNMRKIIAQRLTESKLTIPHFYLTLDCTIDRLLAAREEINGTAPKDKDS